MEKEKKEIAAHEVKPFFVPDECHKQFSYALGFLAADIARRPKTTSLEIKTVS
ncbi:hypothetical protein [Paenibacillus gorillae]|uniref:hypothetical protein n=1 Tax=Paenibacillus gorillae TaxID=1243662 RepID=UPI0012DF72D3|nr:hypothetical protein [Paenibacillus gorillae]